MECPICGGPMYDNRETKKSPKQPDYKCKDKDCDKAIWLEPKGGKKPTSNAEQAPARPKWTWGQLQRQHKAALVAAHKNLKALAKSEPEMPVPQASDYLQAAACLFIEACRAGVQPPEPEE